MEAKTSVIGAAQRKWIQILHVAKRECALNDEAYRTLLYGAAGGQTARGIKKKQKYKDVLKALSKLRF